MVQPDSSKPPSRLFITPRPRPQLHRALRIRFTAAALALGGLGGAALAGTPADAARPRRPGDNGCIVVQRQQGPARSTTQLVNRCAYAVAVTYCVRGAAHDCEAAGLTHLAPGASTIVDSRRAARGLRNVNWVACRSDAEETAGADPEPLLRTAALGPY
jgi:hypothetical protein